MIENRVTLLDQYAFFFRRRQNHSPVRTVDFKLDGHLRRLLVNLLFRIDERLILVVSGLQIGHAVENNAWITNLQFFLQVSRPLYFRLECVLLRERTRKTAPDTVRVQLERHTDIIDELLCHLNNARARERDNSSHFHGVPSRAFSHDVSVKRVQNTLVRELQGIVQRHHIGRFFRLEWVTFLFRRGQSSFPFFIQPFILVPPVTKRSHGIDVKTVLFHANRTLSRLYDGFFHDFSVYFLRVHLQARLLCRFLFLSAQILPKTFRFSRNQRREPFDLQLRFDLRVV